MTRALIGCGKMGGALLRGWLARGVPGPFTVVEPGELPEGCVRSDVRHVRTVQALEADPAPDTLVLAVKPQTMQAVCESLRSVVGPRTLVVSIAAGWTVESFRQIFGPAQSVVRAMPNTPAAIGKGMTVAVASPGTTPEQRRAADELLGVTGHLEWIEDEGLMDAVTAVSGSGPAYVFALIETLARAGAGAGLDPALAMRLARQTVVGAAGLAEQEPERSAQALREAVTSPGGTTQAALEVLLAQDALPSLMARTVAAALARGRALGG
jgi:pyrroline-5-carboxylate reductase